MNLFKGPVGNIPLEEDSKSVTGVQGSAIFNSQTDSIHFVFVQSEKFVARFDAVDGHLTPTCYTQIPVNIPTTDFNVNSFVQLVK